MNKKEKKNLIKNIFNFSIWIGIPFIIAGLFTIIYVNDILPKNHIAFILSISLFFSFFFAIGTFFEEVNK